MAFITLDNDLLAEEIFADQNDPVEPKIENPYWGRLQTFDFWAGATRNADSVPNLQTSLRNGADWFANPDLKPPPNSRDVRVWDFSDVIASGDASIQELIDIVKEYRQRNYYYDVSSLLAYWKLPGDPTEQIPVILAAGTTFYVPNSYFVDEAGGLTTQKTWEEWAGPNQTIFEITGSADPTDDGYWIASSAGTVGNWPTAGSILYLMDLRGVVDKMYSTAEFQALLPTETP